MIDIHIPREITKLKNAGVLVQEVEISYLANKKI